MKQLTKEDFFRFLGTDERDEVTAGVWTALEMGGFVITRPWSPLFPPYKSMRDESDERVDNIRAEDLRHENQEIEHDRKTFKDFQP